MTATISNRLGLHARPAMAFVDAACTFASAIHVRRTDQSNADWLDGKSIMELMMLAAVKGTVLEIAAEGDDATAACQRLKELVEGGFDEE